MGRVTKHEFAQIKRWLIIYHALGGVQRVARRANRSVKTIVQIKNSKTFADYSEQCKAQHPPINYSLAEDVFAVHRYLYASASGEYIRPLTARIAINDIKQRLIEDARQQV